MGLMSVYNERDIIEYTILHMQAQEIPLLVIDNGSTDGTSEILRGYVQKSIVELATVKTEFFEWGLLLRTLHGMAAKYNPRWLLLMDADEFLESPFPSLSLRKAIELEDSRGYNLIQLNNFEFWPTEKEKDSLEPDPRRRIRYYSWNDDWQFKCFRNYPGFNVDETGSHFPVFPKGVTVKLAPEKFVMRHYAIRSYEQGLRKVFEERLVRYPEHEKKKWGLHKYTKFGREEKYFIIDSSLLTEYREDRRWVLERKFDGHRGYGFPSIKSSEEIEKEMEKIRRGLESRGK
jgi:glycosyltransferase involved in cell wall biosynthesis